MYFEEYFEIGYDFDCKSHNLVNVSVYPIKPGSFNPDELYGYFRIFRVLE
jgi:hypothetical protein